MPADEPIKIFAIDDDETILDIYENGLSAKGYEVTVFADPSKAKEVLLKGNDLPHVILMDIMMPAIDGISLMRELKNNQGTSRIPVIAVSGLSDAATLNDALLFGAADYMVKPFDIDTLDLKIKKAFRFRRGKDES